MVMTKANASKCLDHEAVRAEDCKCGANPESGPVGVNVVPHLTEFLQV